MGLHLSTNREGSSSSLAAAYLAMLQHPLGQALLDRWLPAYFFWTILVSKVLALGQRVISAAGDVGSCSLVAYVFQQTLSVVFIGVVVWLFLVRRTVVGRRSPLHGAAIAFAGTFILTLLGSYKVDEEATAAVVASAVLVLVGTAVALWGLISLGQCFGMMPEARGLVTHGPYRLVRHPVYLGETIAAVGLVVGAPSVEGALVVAVFVGLQYLRALMEEQVLEEAFPEYRTYRERTYRIIPWVH